MRIQVRHTAEEGYQEYEVTEIILRDNDWELRMVNEQIIILERDEPDGK